MVDNIPLALCILSFYKNYKGYIHGLVYLDITSS
jgi:hypothetical protein